MSIAVLLLGGLYVIMDVQLRHVQAGRDVMQQGLLSRALLARMDSDIKGCLGPTVPIVSPTTTGQPSTAAGTTSTTSTQTGSGGSSATATSNTSSTTTTVSAMTGWFQAGVQGDSTRLVLFVGRAAADYNPANTPDDPQGQPVAGDLRRVTWWLAGNPVGLARQEANLLTSDEDLSMGLPEGGDEASSVIAEEVRSLQFQYFDGSAWRDSWDGSAKSSDGRSLLGPPRAIAITIGLVPPGTNRNRSSEIADSDLKYHRHVIAIPTANGATGSSTGGVP